MPRFSRGQGSGTVLRRPKIPWCLVGERPNKRLSFHERAAPESRVVGVRLAGCVSLCVKLRGRLIVNVPSGTRRTRRIFECGGRADSPASRQQQLASQSSASPHGTKTTPCPASAGFWFTRPLGEAVDLLQARPLFRLQRSCKSQARAESSPCPGMYTRTFRSIASLAAPWRGAFPVSNPHAGAAPKLGSQVYGRCSWPAASRDSATLRQMGICRAITSFLAGVRLARRARIRVFVAP